MEENLEEKESSVGKLFNSIVYTNPKVLEQFIDEMNEELAWHVIVKACKFAYQKQVFDMLETEVLSKALRIFTKKDEEPDSTI